MTDAADRAQERETCERAEALARRARRAFHEEPRVVKGERWCLDCDEPLPKRRLKAAPEAVRCVDCQQLHEQRQRRDR